MGLLLTATEKKTRLFVDAYGDGIIDSITNTGLFFPAMIAQSCWESGYGQKIPEGSNNFAGIKYNPSIHSGYVLSDTSEYKNGVKIRVKAKFAKFRTVKEGFDAHISLLVNNSRYVNARLKAVSPENQLYMIAAAGYCTTPPSQYSNSMRPIIRACQDYVPLGRIY